jgi:hypothetical protein
MSNDRSGMSNDRSGPTSSKVPRNHRAFGWRALAYPEVLLISKRHWPARNKSWTSRGKSCAFCNPEEKKASEKENLMRRLALPSMPRISF